MESVSGACRVQGAGCRSLRFLCFQAIENSRYGVMQHQADYCSVWPRCLSPDQWIIATLPPFATCSLALRNFPRFPIDRDGSKSIILGEWLDRPDHWVWTSKDTEYGVAPCARSGLGLDPDRHGSLGPCSLRRYSVLFEVATGINFIVRLGSRF